MGAGAIFGPGTSTRKCIEWIEKTVEEKRKRSNEAAIQGLNCRHSRNVDLEGASKPAAVGVPNIMGRKYPGLHFGGIG